MPTSPPVQLDYANPLDDQPAGSDAVIEYGENSVTITIPPRGWKTLLSSIAGASFFIACVLVEWGFGTRRFDRILPVLEIAVQTIAFVTFAFFTLAEGSARALKPATLNARPGFLRVKFASWFRRDREYRDLQSNQLRISGFGFGIGWKKPRFRQHGFLVVTEKGQTRGSIIDHRRKNELLWIKRQLGNVLDSTVGT